MASMMTKRQQARNEKALQDLLRNVPGNDKCADCSATNPGKPRQFLGRVWMWTDNARKDGQAGV